MKVVLRWLRVLTNICFFAAITISTLNYKTSIYLLHQAKGQLNLLLSTQTLTHFEETRALSLREKENIQLIKEIKNYSVDSLGFTPTKNFTTIYDQKDKPILWVITACKPYSLQAFEWAFPLVGKVSYKGFFNKELALKEYNHLVVLGYDTDLRSVSAWSTLGWFNDPILSNMLKRSKGGLCNLLFHELFHATYYAPNSVDFNENIASFIAHKATIQFLQKDSIALAEYLSNYNDTKVFSQYMLRSIERLKAFYSESRNHPKRSLLKLHCIMQIADSIAKLPLKNKELYLSRKKEIVKSKNAYFVDFVQYDSMQDSLDKVFNKIYKGNIEKMARDLKVN
ncbi:aminopeptidase [Aurantibacillus circumpalustris]|uniref:aminopeptidase n=1 Tax=Aurantibacillus circumpalustris TaxID=3036359 RepID=UPI00295BBE98|nr:aminopeptidase [Aurantibacillus circumpalustris]